MNLHFIIGFSYSMKWWSVETDPNCVAGKKKKKKKKQLRLLGPELTIWPPCPVAHWQRNQTHNEPGRLDFRGLRKDQGDMGWSLLGFKAHRGEPRSLEERWAEHITEKPLLPSGLGRRNRRWSALATQTTCSEHSLRLGERRHSPHCNLGQITLSKHLFPHL